MGEVPLETQQSEAVINNNISQTTKLELAHYLRETIFISTISSLLKEVKQSFLKTSSGLTENLIKNHCKKSRNTTMGHLHMKRQGR